MMRRDKPFKSIYAWMKYDRFKCSQFNATNLLSQGHTNDCKNALLLIFLRNLLKQIIGKSMKWIIYFLLMLLILLFNKIVTKFSQNNEQYFNYTDDWKFWWKVVRLLWNTYSSNLNIYLWKLCLRRLPHSNCIWSINLYIGRPSVDHVCLKNQQ